MPIPFALIFAAQIMIRKSVNRMGLHAQSGIDCPGQMMFHTRTVHGGLFCGCSTFTSFRICLNHCLGQSTITAMSMELFGA